MKILFSKWEFTLCQSSVRVLSPLPRFTAFIRRIVNFLLLVSIELTLVWIKCDLKFILCRIGNETHSRPPSYLCAARLTSRILDEAWNGGSNFWENYFKSSLRIEAFVTPHLETRSDTRRISRRQYWELFVIFKRAFVSGLFIFGDVRKILEENLKFYF